MKHTRILGSEFILIELIQESRGAVIHNTKASKQQKKESVTRCDTANQCSQHIVYQVMARNTNYN